MGFFTFLLILLALWQLRMFNVSDKMLQEERDEWANFFISKGLAAIEVRGGMVVSCWTLRKLIQQESIEGK